MKDELITEKRMKCNGRVWFFFGLFTFILFLKNIIFHYSVFHTVLLSSIWREPLNFFIFYSTKVVVPLFIASFLLITRRWWWSIAVSILLDIWCISNIIYHRTYDMFLTVDDVLMAGNMGGAWSAVAQYIDKYVLALVLTTVMWLALIMPLYYRGGA